ncbi:MAG: CDP-alcohol phosphatidyltransferase family protein [Rhodobacteraceae bacterium]|nr:CDP-alcohol phosphatidyltransferase family protein [Paracoccaceae bacterium]MCZ8082457.1 CDP-alcohol phosphatidyltransferase family protein [Paracoccaceae bacterium]
MTVEVEKIRSRVGLPAGFWPAAVLALLVALVPLVLRPEGGGRAALIALAGTGAVLVLIRGKLALHFPHARFGLCNVVTLARAAMVAALAGMLWQGPQGWDVLALASVALALDGVDGWLARRSGLLSDFGARFDMETDAALALVLAAHVWLGGMTGAEVLLLGVMRYAFVAAFWPFPWLAAALPDRFGRKVVCVVQIAALILLQVPGLMPEVAQVVAWGAVAALVWSFGRDVLWLWRHRG